MTDVLDRLELSVRTTNVLRRHGIETMDAFMRLDKPTVLGMEHAGARTWREIAEVQAAFGQDPIAQRVTHLLRTLNSLPLDPGYFFYVDRSGHVRLAQYCEGTTT